MNKQQAWLRLILAPQLGYATYLKLSQQHTDILALLASPSLLAKAKLKPQTYHALLNPDATKLQLAEQWLSKPGHHLICLVDESYPNALREIPDPPLALFVEGDIKVLRDPQLAIVGSRRPTSYGKENAFAFAKHFAETGLTITSGLAWGIDATAHQGALKGHGQTIAVLGCGIDQIYPANHQSLAEDIRQSGALISEYPPGTPLHPGLFPKRNRIISGLSVGTLIVEAGLKSGSLISARLAMEQGREVFAIPGSIHNPMTKGCHQLIQSGVKLVESAEDILQELQSALSPYLQPKKDRIAQAVSEEKEPLGSEYLAFLDYIGYDSTPTDLIIDRSGLSVPEAASMLLMLELQGHIRATAGGYMRV